MKILNLSALALALFVAAGVALPAWAEQPPTQGLKAIEKDEALTAGTTAAESVTKDTPAIPLEVGAVIVGEVVSKDLAKNTITIKEDKAWKYHTIAVINSDILRTLQKGNRVRISLSANSQTGATVFKA